MRTNRTDPGEVKDGYNRPPTRNSRLVDFKCNPGDSGSPVFKRVSNHNKTRIVALGIVISRRTSDHNCVYSHIQYIKDETSFQVRTNGGG